MEAPVSPRTGVRIDPGRLDHALAVRGITARQLAAAIGVHEVLLSRARNGHNVREATFRKIADGLAAFPLVDGAAELIAEPAG